MSEYAIALLIFGACELLLIFAMWKYTDGRDKL